MLRTSIAAMLVITCVPAILLRMGALVGTVPAALRPDMPIELDRHSRCTFPARC
jgi:hypothetical protein